MIHNVIALTFTTSKQIRTDAVARLLAVKEHIVRILRAFAYIQFTSSLETLTEYINHHNPSIC